MTPLLIELFAGTGEVSQQFAARGWMTCAFDIQRDFAWPDDLPHILADVHQLAALARIHNAPIAHRPALLWCSPPCQEYSLAARRPPEFSPDLRLWRASTDLHQLTGFPHIIENVSGAQRYHGAAAHHFGKVYLWGDAVPPLLPQGPRWKDPTHKSQRSTYRLRSRIPTALSSSIADFHTAHVLATGAVYPRSGVDAQARAG
jgi:hypothetical protein